MSETKRATLLFLVIQPAAGVQKEMVFYEQ